MSRNSERIKGEIKLKSREIEIIAAILRVYKVRNCSKINL
jgi:hypothetical protein